MKKDIKNNSQTTPLAIDNFEPLQTEESTLLSLGIPIEPEPISSDSTFSILDKVSPEYREAKLTNHTKRPKTSLEEAIEVSGHLSKDKKVLFTSLAQLYLTDMAHNIFKSQFDLSEDYPDYTIDEWQEFLTDRIVSVYIDKHKRTVLKTAAEDNLASPDAKNKRDSLKLIEAYEAKERKEAQKNVVIIRLPDVYDTPPSS